MPQHGQGKIASAGFFHGIFLDVKGYLVNILNESLCSALIEISSVISVDNAFSVSPVVIDDRKISVCRKKTHECGIASLMLVFSVYHLNDSLDISRILRLDTQYAERQVI